MKKTLDHQAHERKILGHKNPNKISIYQQGKNTDIWIIAQKYKDCNLNKHQLP